MRIRILLGTAAASLVALTQACVGDDPPAAPPPAADAATDVPSSPNDAGGSATEAGPGDYGVFLSNKLFPTSFAAGVTAENVAALVDGECRAAAAIAGLPRAEAYLALITVSRGRDTTGDVRRFTAMRSADAQGKKWCSISGTTPHRPDCSLNAAVIFSTPEDFQTGPRNRLLFTEYGIPTPAENLSTFYSGVATRPDGLQAVRNCNGWTVREPFGEDGHLDGGVEVGFGFGDVKPVGSDGGAQFGWIAGGFTYCTEPVSMPFLCVEVPPT